MRNSIILLLQKFLPVLAVTFIPQFNTGLCASISGQVFAVTSGDQITLSLTSRDFREIRLLGIESHAPDTTTGRLARRHLHMLVAGKHVTVTYRTLSPQGKILGRVFHGGTDINLRMIEAGQVRVSTNSEKDQGWLNDYLSAQDQARERRLGIWKNKRDQ